MVCLKLAWPTENGLLVLTTPWPTSKRCPGLTWELGLESTQRTAISQTSRLGWPDATLDLPPPFVATLTHVRTDSVSQKGMSIPYNNKDRLKNQSEESVAASVKKWFVQTMAEEDKAAAK
jgi:hypothetical protein